MKGHRTSITTPIRQMGSRSTSRPSPREQTFGYGGHRTTVVPSTSTTSLRSAAGRQEADLAPLRWGFYCEKIEDLISAGKNQAALGGGCERPVWRSPPERRVNSRTFLTSKDCSVPWSEQSGRHPRCSSSGERQRGDCPRGQPMSCSTQPACPCRVRSRKSCAPARYTS